jgi:hypothetical protein
LSQDDKRRIRSEWQLISKSHFSFFQ